MSIRDTILCVFLVADSNPVSLKMGMNCLAGRIQTVHAVEGDTYLSYFHYLLHGLALVSSPRLCNPQPRGV